MTKKERKEVLNIIKEGRDGGYSGDEIAKELNEGGYTTLSGKNWTAANVSGFGIKYGLPRKVSTVAGAAGTKGTKHRPSEKARRKAQKTARNNNQMEFNFDGTDSYGLMQAIFTSNLPDTKKRKLVDTLVAEV